MRSKSPLLFLFDMRRTIKLKIKWLEKIRYFPQDPTCVRIQSGVKQKYGSITKNVCWYCQVMDNNARIALLFDIWYCSIFSVGGNLERGQIVLNFLAIMLRGGYKEIYLPIYVHNIETLIHHFHYVDIYILQICCLTEGLRYFQTLENTTLSSCNTSWSITSGDSWQRTSLHV